MMKASNSASSSGNFSLIFKLYARALFPNIIAVLGSTMNVFFDSILVGRKLGDAGLEAVNMSFPLYLILCAIGSLIASGAAQLSSVAFGRTDMTEGRRVFSSALTLATVFSVGFCALSLLASTHIAIALSRPAIFEYVLIYARIIPIGGIFKVLLYLPYYYLRLEGKNRYSMIIMLAMTAINIVLDYVFLYICDWSIAGVGWANAIATAAACIMGFVFLCNGESNFKFSFSKPSLKDVVRIGRFGAIMAMDNCLLAAKIFSINKILGQMPVAGMTAIFSVVNNMSEFSMCIQTGVPQAAAAITGMLYAEHDTSSLKKLLATQLAAGLCTSLAFAYAMGVFAPSAAWLFGSSEDARFAVIMLAASLPLAVANNTMCYYYNATGNVGLANLITACRAYAIAVLCCSVFAGLGEKVWVFFPVAEAVTSIIYIAVGAAIARTSGFAPFFLLENEEQSDIKAISLSVHYNSYEINGARASIQEFCEECRLDPRSDIVVNLFVEEMFTALQREVGAEGSAYLRLSVSERGVVLRLRFRGEKFNPLARTGGQKYLGLRLAASLAKSADYQHTLGVNTFAIFIK